LRMKEMIPIPRPALYLAWIGSAAREWVFPVVHRLRKAGLTVELEGEQRSLKSQMKRADKLRARHVLIVGDEELQKRKGMLRDMDSKEQSELKLDMLEDELRERLQ